MNLSVQNISVCFSHKTALDSVSIEFMAGKIHILIGENGAGKSTLTNVICGDLYPTSGSIFINNKKVTFKSPADAIKNGIVCVHQHPFLAQSISIKENLQLGLHHFNKEEAYKLLKEWLPDVKPGTLVKNLGGDERFFTSLCGALLKKPALLILDEPSALLDLQQREQLFSKLRKFADDGMNIIVITHYMEEAKKYADTITYLEKGRITDSASEFLNKKITAENYSYTNTKKTDLQLVCKNLNSRPVNKPAIFDINFTAKAGEITLICGAVESGRETLEDLICAMSDAPSSGIYSIEKSDKKITYKIKKGNLTRRKLEKSGFSFGIIPSDKTFRGSNPQLSILQLLTGNIKGKQSELEKLAGNLIKKADINININEKASCLSGGMLQRLILERELAKKPDILILCEPVQGLDVISIQNFCNRFEELAAEGKIVLILSSSEFPEHVCHKIYNLNNGLLQEVR